MGYSRLKAHKQRSKCISSNLKTFKMIATVLALVAVIAVANAQPLTLMPPSPFEATECGNMGYNSMQIGPNCYFWVTGSFTMEQAREQCVMKDGILATLHEKVDYDMLKGVVHEKYEFSEENNHLAVFWLDQMFDYDTRTLKCCDGVVKTEAQIGGMWYPGHPCNTASTPNMILAFRSQAYLLQQPQYERNQGLYTIETTSMWNALCMTKK